MPCAGGDFILLSHCYPEEFIGSLGANDFSRHLDIVVSIIANFGRAAGKNLFDYETTVLKAKLGYGKAIIMRKKRMNKAAPAEVRSALYDLVRRDGLMPLSVTSMWLRLREQKSHWKILAQDFSIWQSSDGTLQLSVTTRRMGILVLDSPTTLTLTMAGLDYLGGRAILPTQHLFLCTSILMSSVGLSLSEKELESVGFVSTDWETSLGFVVK